MFSLKTLFFFKKGTIFAFAKWAIIILNIFFANTSFFLYKKYLLIPCTIYMYFLIYLSNMDAGEYIKLLIQIMLLSSLQLLSMNERWIMYKCTEIYLHLYLNIYYIIRGVSSRGALEAYAPQIFCFMPQGQDQFFAPFSAAILPLMKTFPPSL